MFQKIAIIPILIFLSFVSCKTRNEMKREVEWDKLKQEVKDTRGDKAEMEAIVDEVKQELSKMNNRIEEQAVARKHDSDEIKKEQLTLITRIQALEQKITSAEQEVQKEVQERSKSSFENAKKLFEESHFEDASNMLRVVLKSAPRGDELKRVRFLLAESLYADKDYASAALEFSEYRKAFAKDLRCAEAAFYQAQAFKQMGKKNESKLFFQEVAEKYPRSSFAVKAKAELKKLK